MQIVPGDRPRDRSIVLSTGERLTLDQLVSYFLPTGSFAHRPQVEAELTSVLDVLALVLERLKEKS
jgi:hypothetical protein